MIEIRLARESDKPQVWEIVREVIAGGDTYVFKPDSPPNAMLDYWFAADKKTYVARREEKTVGTFFLKDNQPGLGAHVANAGFMVAKNAGGKGVGRRMAEFALREAARLGYQAMQFNFVVKSNEKAVRLWLDLGFQIVGEIPEAFDHRTNGLTNVYVMHRKL